MKLEENFFRYQNPNTDKELLVMVELTGEVGNPESRENVRVNTRRDVPWLKEVPQHDDIAVICGAGPSIEDTWQQIAELKNSGATIFCCNSSADFLLSKGIEVDYQVIVDPHPDCKNIVINAKTHLLGSPVYPQIFDIVENPILWNPDVDWIDEYLSQDKEFTYIGGGVTVTNSAMCIAYTLGFREIHVHGMDSSYREDKSHIGLCRMSYDDVLAITVEENGRIYNTSYDMKQQVLVFRLIHDQLKNMGCTIKVYGSGLLPDLFKAN